MENGLIRDGVLHVSGIDGYDGIFKSIGTLFFHCS